MWFRITEEWYKVVQEEICLHWASFEPEQPHIMHSSATDHVARETHSIAPRHKHSVGFLPTCLGGRKQAKVFEGGRGLFSKILPCIYIFYLLALFCNNFQSRNLLFQMTIVQPDHITTSNQALWRHICRHILIVPALD